MKDIKFRAWNKVLQYMGRVSLLAFHNDGTIKAFEVIDDKPILERKGKEGYGKLEDFILMQYTGLKDKNWKEIFEGDILQDNEQRRIVVIWLKGDAGFMAVDIDEYPKEEPTYLTDDVWVTKEIVGNIYENPELLSQP